MRPSHSRQLLGALLTGDIPSGSDLQTFVAANPTEDQWFDYKAGALLADPKAKEKIRQSVSALANTEGGFLLVGYDQPAKTFDGAKAPGGGSLTEWAARVCGSLQALPSPRFVSVMVNGVEALLIATDRSTPLIPVVENGEPVHYGRFGDQTLRLPQSLVTDLMVGRRARPDLRLRVDRAGIESVAQDTGNPNIQIARVGLVYRPRNSCNKQTGSLV